MYIQRELGSLNTSVTWQVEKLIAQFLLTQQKIEMILNLILTESGGKLNIIEFRDPKFMFLVIVIEKQLKR